MSIITENKKLENKALTQDGRRLDNTPQFPCRLESEKTLPPAIQQFYAIGYSVGDYVCGRCYHKDKNTVEWEGYLTDSDIDLYRMKPTGEYDENRDRVWKRQEHHPQGLSFLKKINNQGYDIFFSVNGGRNNNAVDRVKAFIFESDTASVPEQLAMINEFPIKPSLVVYTGGKSLHTYYAISGDCSKEDWQRTQECLTLATNSDPAIKDLPRLFRLAGFNHQKSGNTSEIKVINSVSYTHSEVSTAIEQYYPDAKCPRLYNLYKYVALINASKDYPDLPSDYAYKCETIAERGEELTRLKKYTKLLRQGKTTEAEDLLNTPLKDLVDRFEEERQEWKERASKTYHIRTVPSEGDTLSTVTGTLASRFCEGFNLEGRAEYHTCRCPVHKGESEDSLHIHKESGGLKCQSGCDSIEVEEELRRLAREKGDPLADCSFAKYETSPHLEKIKKSLKLSGKKSAKRYVNDLEDMAKVQDSRLVVIKSPMNTGKTYAINQQVNQSDNPVLATTHRRLLTRELCRKFGIPYIEDEGAKKSPSKGLCIHSWHEFGQAQFSPEQARDSVIVIDEVDQTLWELVAGKTIKNRSFIVQNLRESLRLAKQVWVASAHVTQWEVNFLQRLTDEDPLIIENTYKPAKEAGAEVNVLSKLEQFYPRLENDLEDGKQIICFVPGQKEESTFSTTVLAEHYKERYPNKRIGAVDGETVYEPGHEMFALPEKLQDDPEFLNQFDLLLCTLVINTGISLEHTTFDAVYCHGGTYANSEELAQAMMRVRKFDVPRYILRDPNVHGSVVAKGAETPREVYDYLTKKRDKVLNEINRATNPWEGDLFNYSPDDGVFEEYYIRGLVRRNLDFKYPKAWLCEVLKDEGFTVWVWDKQISIVPKSEEEKPKQDTKDELKFQKVEKIANTPNPSDELYSKLKDKDELTPEERLQVEQGRLCRNLGFDQVSDPEIVEADMDGVTKAFKNHYNITVGDEFVSAKDNKKLRNNGQACFVSDTLNTQTPLRLKLRTLLLHDVFNNFLYTDQPVTNITLRGWFNYVSKHHWDLVKEMVFIDPDKKYPETPIGLLRKFLKKYFELNLDEKGRYRNEKGKRVKHYELADEYEEFRQTVFDNWLQKDQEKQRVDQAKAKVPMLSQISQGEKSIPDNMRLVPLEDNTLKVGEIIAMSGKDFISFEFVTSTKQQITYKEITSGKNELEIDPSHINLQDHLDSLLKAYGADNLYKVVFED